MKQIFGIAAVVVLVCFGVPALALDLQEARQTGVIGEKRDGYVAPIAKSKEVVELATDINAKRKMEYLRISKENGQTVEVVATLAAQQVISNLPKGALYQDASGAWVKK